MRARPLQAAWARIAVRSSLIVALAGAFMLAGAAETHKIHNPAADAKSCTKLIQDTDRQGAEISGRMRFVNNCPTAVEFFWCSDAECTHSSNTWTIHVGGGWPVSGTNVRWGACRGANSGGFDKDSQGQRYTCPNLTEGATAPGPGDSAPVALPRRGSSSGSAMFQEAIGKAEQDERDRRNRPAVSAGVNPGGAAPAQTTVERLEKSFDERISAAREQCISKENGCQKGCLGVAAVGILSIFSGNRASGGAASDQAQQCSNRCDQAKSSCDELVSALEQEKSQAVTAALTPAPTPVAYTSSPGGGSSRYSSVCLRNVEKIDNVMRASRAQQYGASNDLFLKDVNFFAAKLVEPCRASDPESASMYKRAMDEHNRIARVCAGPHDKLQCNQWGFDTSYRARNQSWYSTWKAEVDKALSDSNYSADLDPGASNVRASAGGFSGDCKAAYDRQESEFGPLTKQIGDTKSAVRQSQLTLGMISKRLALLDQLCKGQPQYGEYASMKQSYESTMRACRGVATNPSECVPQ